MFLFFGWPVQIVKEAAGAETAPPGPLAYQDQIRSALSPRQGIGWAAYEMGRASDRPSYVMPTRGTQYFRPLPAGPDAMGPSTTKKPPNDTKAWLRDVMGHKGDADRG